MGVCWCVYVFLSIAACFSLRASLVTFSCVHAVCVCVGLRVCVSECVSVCLVVCVFVCAAACGSLYAFLIYLFVCTCFV